jgi:hypothetical protein
MLIEGKFSFGIKLIWVVQSLLKKYSAFPKQQSVLYLPPSRPTKGALRTSRTRGGMRWTQKMLLTRAFAADGKDVWS